MPTLLAHTDSTPDTATFRVTRRPRRVRRQAEEPMHEPVRHDSPVRVRDWTHARRWVVKLGTRVLVDESGAPRLERLEALARSVAMLRAEGREVLVVTSGAVGLGLGLLGLSEVPTDPQTRRACAAVGQARLQSLYQSAFALHGMLLAQVLLTCRDLGRQGRPQVRATLERLLASNVVPVINENDAVSFGMNAGDPLRKVFRDNDGLAAHVAAGCGAHLLLLLTDVEGVFARDPRHFPGEPHLERVDDAESLLEVLQAANAGTPPEVQPGLSRGGMSSKVAAAAFASARCDVVIASGKTHDLFEQLMAGEAVGTHFPSRCQTNAKTTAQETL